MSLDFSSGVTIQTLDGTQTVHTAEDWNIVSHTQLPGSCVCVCVPVSVKLPTAAAHVCNIRTCDML